MHADETIEVPVVRTTMVGTEIIEVPVMRKARLALLGPIVISQGNVLLCRDSRSGSVPDVGDDVVCRPHPRAEFRSGIARIINVHRNELRFKNSVHTTIVAAASGDLLYLVERQP